MSPLIPCKTWCLCWVETLTNIYVQCNLFCGGRYFQYIKIMLSDMAKKFCRIDLRFQKSSLPSTVQSLFQLCATCTCLPRTALSFCTRFRWQTTLLSIPNRYYRGNENIFQLIIKHTICGVNKIQNGFHSSWSQLKKLVLTKLRKRLNYTNSNESIASSMWLTIHKFFVFINTN